MFIEAGGGRLQLQRGLQCTGDLNHLHLYTQGPFAFLRFWIDSKKPELGDIDDLRWGVEILCKMVTFFSFVQMIFSLQSVFSVGTKEIIPLQQYAAAAAVNVVIFCRIMEVVFITMAMAALRGFDLLVQALNPKAHQDLNIKLKEAYCQYFLAGMRLLPVLCHLGQIACGVDALEDSHGADAPRNVIVCVASAVCCVIAWRAFPADKLHYPQCSGVSVGGDESSPLEKQTLKPVLDQVKFCPFCGSSNLELEVNSSSDAVSAECASCPQCRARHVPLSLVIHRSGKDTAPPALSSKATPGALLKALSED